MARSSDSVASCDSSDSHVVDWQLVGGNDVDQFKTGVHDLRDRIRTLEARALTLLRLVVTNPGASDARGSLAALDREIAGLRADLAWHRAATRVE